MLRVGLTGGIGAGKSTVATRFVERGAVLVDADRIAREVVQPGTEGLAEIVAAFGDRMLAPDGFLDRTALAAVVFGDEAARATVNAIVHPRVRRRSAELTAAAPADGIVVQDVPLLVEGGMALAFPLVVVVHADVDERLRRLVELRGMAVVDARARIAAQADDAARRAAADIWLDNTGVPADLTTATDVLWDARLVPFEANLRARVVPWSVPALVPAVPGWAAAGARLVARVEAAAGEHGRGVAHVGSTAVPGLPAQDVLDLQLGVDTLDAADAVRGALEEAGFPRRADVVHRLSTSAGRPSGRCHGSADPCRPANLTVCLRDSPEWRHALLLRDRLRADPALREEYLHVKQAAQERSGGDRARYVAAKAPWLDDDAARADAWAASSGWVVSLA